MSNVAPSSKPLFEAFQIGAWWYVTPLHIRGDGYLVHFEGYGKHEEKTVRPEYIRLRSRKAKSSDCCHLTRGADVVVFAAHPYAFRTGSNKSLYSVKEAWYDVKIISKQTTHHFYTCACMYTVQFYTDWSRNTESKSTRTLLEGAMMDVSIGEIAIMQVPLDLPVERLIEKSLKLSEDTIKRQWSKDAYTLKLTYHVQQPLYSTTTEHVRKTSTESESDIPLIADTTRNANVEADIRPIVLEISISGCSNDVRGFQDAGNHGKTVKAKLVDLTLSDNLNAHDSTELIEDVCSPKQLPFENGKKRPRIGLSQKVKVIDREIHADRERKQKHERQAGANNESSSFSSDESSSTYMLASSGSDYEESSFDKEEETIEHSHSRSTPVFYGKANSESMEFYDKNQDVDHRNSTSTKTFYGNAAEKSGHSSSTPVFYGSYENELENSSTSNAANVAHDLERVSKIELEGEHCKSLSHCVERDTVKEVDSISTGCNQGDPAHNLGVDEESNCYCKNFPTFSDCSQSVCRACKSLGVESSTPMTRPVNSQEESNNKAQAAARSSKIERSAAKKGQDLHECCSESESVSQLEVLKTGKKNEAGYKPAQNSNIERPTAKSGQDMHDYCSESESMIQLEVLKTGKKNEAGCKRKRKSKHSAIKNKEKKTKRFSLQPRSRTSGKKDRTRSSKQEEGKMNFNNLFDIILNSIDELTRVKMVVPSELPFSSSTQGPNQVSWDPFVFHEKERAGVCLNDLIEDDPLKDMWKHMDSAFEEMHGLTALAEEQPSQDKACACQHELVLNEQEGYVCSHCGLLVTTIENILPPIFLEKVNHKVRDSKTADEEEAPGAAFTNSTGHQNIPRTPLEIDMGSVWKLIPELKVSMKKHQIDGFNFLWENIGALSSQANGKGGGCIIAHAPGTGKSLLIISFLKSFLHLNSWCRPLIVAPKNMLLSWQKEFEKWKAGVKVLLLQSSTPSPLTYLKILSEWQRSTSVLIVTYQLFAKLVDQGRARENQRVGSLLLHIPDILVLDEGHVPRNLSKLRDSLLQIRTRFKILVSGTLFQNNVQELFNLLYLARPNFLDYLQTHHCKERWDKYHVDNDKKQWQTFEEFDSERWMGISHEQAELRSRKFFMEEIGNRLESEPEGTGGDDEFKGAIEKLRAITAPFIHFYNGDILNSLPGIKEFIVVLQATSLQVFLSTKIKQQTFLETSLSIHPSLLLKWKGQKIPPFLDVDRLKALRGDVSEGPKVKFILDLADSCHLLKEKLLVFSQFLKTLELLQEMLNKKYRVAMIKGKDRLEERQRTIDEFNEPEGTSIILASLTACGEGINLTGASRVVFLDMHWNPARMKQAAARAFRIGQQKTVYTYWLIASVEKEAEKFTRIQRKNWLSRSIFSLETEVTECHHQESTQSAEVEDYVLAQLCKNDVTRSILKVLNYSASERKKPFECYSFSGK